MWIKNTGGKPDAMLTFAFFSFLVVTLNVLLSTFGTLTIGDFQVVFTSLDSSVMAVYLGSTFTAYVSRRWTDKRYDVSINSQPSQPQFQNPYVPAPPTQTVPAQAQSPIPGGSGGTEPQSMDTSIDLGSI